MNSQRCSDVNVNSNFDPTIELQKLVNSSNVDEAKSIFINNILTPMEKGRIAAITKEKAALFKIKLEQIRSKDRVVSFAYNLALSGMGLGTGKRI